MLVANDIATEDLFYKSITRSEGTNRPSSDVLRLAYPPNRLIFSPAFSLDFVCHLIENNQR